MHLYDQKDINEELIRYIDSVCVTDSTWVLIHEEGYKNLKTAPAFHSMNMDAWWKWSLYSNSIFRLYFIREATRLLF